jgi:hypothetical protein
VARVAEALGYEFMPWQRQVADVALEIDPATGLFAYSGVGLSTPRQSGKTVEISAVMQHRALSGLRRRVWYTAQSGKDAADWFLDEHAPLIETSPVLAGAAKVSRAAGRVGVFWPRLQSMVRVFPPTKKALHSKATDLVMVDECWAHDPVRGEELDQAIVPTQATRPGAQVWKVSTAGTADSDWFWRTVSAGRAAVEAGRRSGVAWFEWACPEDLDPCAPASWPQFHPAFGTTIGVAQMRAALDDLGAEGFARAYGNQWDRADGAPVIGDLDWRACRDPGSVKPGPGVACSLGFDAETHGADAAVSLAWRDGQRLRVLVEVRPATGWLAGRVEELAAAWRVGSVCYQRGGPAGHVADELSRGVLASKLRPVGGVDYSAACAWLLSAVTSRSLAVAPHPALDEAAAGAVRRPHGEAWVWGRRSSSVSLAPLVAANLSGWAVLHPPARAGRSVMVMPS